MCNCKETTGFKQQQAEAKRLTELTGGQHVVYHMKAVGLNFVGKETDLNDELGICCYYLPDGTEKLYTPSSAIAKMNVTSTHETGTPAPAATTPEMPVVKKISNKNIKKKIVPTLTIPKEQ